MDNKERAEIENCFKERQKENVREYYKELHLNNFIGTNHFHMC